METLQFGKREEIFSLSTVKRGNKQMKRKVWLFSPHLCSVYKKFNIAFALRKETKIF